MTLQQIKPGDELWYLYHLQTNGMTYQQPVKVVSVKGTRVRVRKRNGALINVLPKNLRPTP